MADGGLPAPPAPLQPLDEPPAQTPVPPAQTIMPPA